MADQLTYNTWGFLYKLIPNYFIKLHATKKKKKRERERLFKEMTDIFKKNWQEVKKNKK